MPNETSETMRTELPALSDRTRLGSITNAMWELLAKRFPAESAIPSYQTELWLIEREEQLHAAQREIEFITAKSNARFAELERALADEKQRWERMRARAIEELWRFREVAASRPRSRFGNDEAVCMWYSDYIHRVCEDFANALAPESSAREGEHA